MAPLPQETQDLIDGYVAGTLHPPARQRLAELLRVDESARRVYLEYMDLNAALHWAIGGRDKSRRDAQTLAAAVAPDGPVDDSDQGGQYRFLNFRSVWPTAGFFVLGALAAVLVTCCLSPQKPARETAPALQVASGSATLKLPDVGYIVLEGPAELEMIDAMRARLKQGRIRVHVTEKTGLGFVVESPHGKVTDLGTEFGLEVSPPGANKPTTSLVVFGGSVDLEQSRATSVLPVQRLVGGEGVVLGADGGLDRIMSIVTGRAPTFERGSEARARGSTRVILDVSDNLRASQTRKFYEIVPGGLREDALAYCDRPEHEWNGMTSDGMPQYLLGADYVKPFNDYRIEETVEIRVRLGCAAKLCVFLDDRLEPPRWLQESFRQTGDKIGMDLGKWQHMVRPHRCASGPGKSIDQRFTVWERIVKKPGIVTLGANGVSSKRPRARSAMYGIAAVAMEPAAPANDR